MNQPLASPPPEEAQRRRVCRRHLAGPRWPITHSRYLTELASPYLNLASACSTAELNTNGVKEPVLSRVFAYWHNVDPRLGKKIAPGEV